MHYKRNKSNIDLCSKAASKFNAKDNGYASSVDPKMRVGENVLLLVCRIKGRNSTTTPQAQKILSELGLREINNAVFIRADPTVMTQMRMIKEYVSFGYPTKKIVNDLVRKRGFLKKDDAKLPITDNNLIEELLGGDENSDQGCICIEDIIDTIYKCFHEENKETFYKI